MYNPDLAYFFIKEFNSYISKHVGISMHALPIHMQPWELLNGNAILYKLNQS